MNRILLWNVYGRDRRTNNNLEGFNSALSTILMKSKSNFWTYLISLQEENMRQEIKYLQHRQPNFVPPQVPKKYRNREAEILRLTAMLTAEPPTLTPIRFVTTLANFMPN